jgi:hypothetical protein
VNGLNKNGCNHRHLSHNPLKLNAQWHLAEDDTPDYPFHSDPWGVVLSVVGHDD